MSPAQFRAKRSDNINNALYASHLKINKDSHCIQKPSPPLSSSSTAGVRPQLRHPVIIYTHSPKIIHTHPSNFMSLVQKLTGLSPANSPIQPKAEPNNHTSPPEEEKKNNSVKDVTTGDDNEESSVVTEENCISGGGDIQVNSGLVPPMFDPPNPCFNNIPLFTSNHTDILCSNQPFFNYTDSLFLMPNMRSSILSSTLEAMKEFREF
ncbi:VQ motif-containing protein 20 [Cornus florida]|uniref:VQ motif-containing protein 20 n=1 Tax=Cornus florida TaxID=4283 RepID=UPI0028999895|nr:VQ motif-containing protein 20 [Cornus florida]